MSCYNAQERISFFVDGRLPAAEGEAISAHIESCRDCKARLEAMQALRMALAHLDCAPVPATLASRLHVLASHERVRQLARSSLRTWVNAWTGRLSLLFENLMRPMALPFAGGLVSALIIFGLLVPNLTFSHAFADSVVFLEPPGGNVVMLSPAGPYMPQTESDNAPRIERAGGSIPETANVVDVTIDQSGRVSDWCVARGELTPDLTSIIMFGQFNPATSLGVPMSGKLRLVQIRNVWTAPIRVRS